MRFIPSLAVAASLIAVPALADTVDQAAQLSRIEAKIDLLNKTLLGLPALPAPVGRSG